MNPKWTCVLIGLVALTIGPACGLLSGTEGISISMPVQEFDFDLDANVARDKLQQHLNNQLTPPAQVDLTNETEIPAQVCAGTPEVCVDVPAVSETFEIDLPAQQIDLSNEDDLKKYIEAGTVKSVEIEYINYELAANSLNFNLPSVDLYLDDHGTTAMGANSKKFAVMPAISAGQTGEGGVAFVEGGQEAFDNYLLKEFKFAMLGKTQVTVDTAVTRSIPSGQLQGKVKIKLKFKVDPL